MDAGQDVPQQIYFARGHEVGRFSEIADDSKIRSPAANWKISPGVPILKKVKLHSPIFFSKPAAFRTWLEKNHHNKSEQWVGFHRKASGRPSITWPEAVDEALCFGWIDGLRKTIDAESYNIRFTPRRATSNWSAVNIRRMKELIRERRVRPAGIKAFQKRMPERSGSYSYENRKSATLSAAAKKLFRADSAAWKFFQRQPASYRQTAIWWTVSAKRPETRQDRLRKLIALSKAGRRI
jgi:uncharacterized protein YdeI (YjbR/CyaY-like superfamily)